MSARLTRDCGNLPVLVCGEALVDVFDTGMVAGGAAFNVACHLAGLGVMPRFISRIGDDAAGSLLREAATGTGLRLDAVQIDPQRPTGRVLVHRRGAGHVFEIAPDQAWDHIDGAAALRDATTRQLLSMPSAWLYHGTLVLRSPDSRRALLDLREVAACRVFVDMNWRDAGLSPHDALQALRGVDMLKLNDEELVLVLDWLHLNSSRALELPCAGETREAMAALMRSLRIGTLLVTHGDAGAVCWDEAGRCVQIRAVPEVAALVDTVGAGDAFSAAMLAALASSWSPARALSLAVEFAAAVCSIRGAVPAQPDFHVRWRTVLSAVDGGVHP